jgi:hypothetical protein
MLRRFDARRQSLCLSPRYLPEENTSDLRVDRGTMQGDSLSPFLFALYLEPLLRGLHVGEKG